MRAKRPTSFDIAELAGVSQSTVSRALRHDSMVSEDTRLKVERAARQLNYKVDVNARNLRSQKTNTLALLIYEDPGTSDSLINPFFLAMLSSVTRAAARHGYDLLVSFQQQSGEGNADYAASKRADGIIFLGYGDYPSYIARIARLDEAGIPHITWGPVLPGQPGHFIGSDNVQGAREAVTHLIAAGRRHIGFIGDISENCPEFRDRHRGYLLALEQAGLSADPALHLDAEASEQDGHRAALTLLDRGRPLDAIFAACDLLAIGALHGARDRGLTVPGDLSIVGFDDIQAALYTNPPLTTVRQDTEAAGRLLVENLLRLMEDRPIDQTIIPTRLVVRGSCRRVG
ncbi:LacI family DNA-binding transcriptional regulator [Niveispirillum sp. BGYR6]|uniref:LacI family DNA-binding transcriptional regulator n=1 Tax=Niveispirillum sp. BGYR6 TaxID=2971249 RepID=UPI0022B9C38A|nr:LacI family DNA-binding transcriptional regulator [Niveispirillum sp. BGYR6]MDG5496690.1 LacI family DNA-binding transcriptional regulator [Niveispirillum sp. BGYR6]